MCAERGVAAGRGVGAPDSGQWSGDTVEQGVTKCHGVGSKWDPVILNSIKLTLCSVFSVPIMFPG